MSLCMYQCVGLLPRLRDARANGLERGDRARTSMAKVQISGAAWQKLFSVFLSQKRAYVSRCASMSSTIEKKVRTGFSFIAFSVSKA